MSIFILDNYYPCFIAPIHSGIIIEANRHGFHTRPKTAKCRLNCSDGIFKTVLRLNANACRNRRLRVMRRQKRSGKLPAAAATGCHAQLRLQITHCGRACGNSFFDLMVGNGIADTDKHFILRVFSNYHTDSGFYYRMQI